MTSRSRGADRPQTGTSGDGIYWPLRTQTLPSYWLPAPLQVHKYNRQVAPKQGQMGRIQQAAGSTLASSAICGSTIQVISVTSFQEPYGEVCLTLATVAPPFQESDLPHYQPVLPSAEVADSALKAPSSGCRRYGSDERS